MDESRFVPARTSSEPPDVSDLRCVECDRLIHASPKHESWCRYAGQNCPGCVYVRQPHIAACPIASQLKLAGDDCCEGVDLPTVGHVHSPTCGNPRPVVRASHTLPEAERQAAMDAAVFGKKSSVSAPAALAVLDFSDLMGELLFAARDMAQSRVINPESGVGGVCFECTRAALAEPLRHDPLCKTGRVLAVLDKLCGLAPGVLASSMAVFGGAQ